MTRKHHSPEYKTRITADIGAEVPADCVALISTTLGAGAIVQARFSNVARFSVTLADTGLLNVEAQDESQGNVVLVAGGGGIQLLFGGDGDDIL